MSLVVVVVIIALSCVWYFTSSEEAGDAGGSGRATRRRPTRARRLHAAPDWYFLLPLPHLRIFKWPESVILGPSGPDDPPHPPRRGAVHRPAARPPPCPAARCGRRGAARDRVHGDPHLQGATAEEPSATSGAALPRVRTTFPPTTSRSCRASLRGGRLPELPHVQDAGRGRADRLSNYYTQERGVDYWVDWIRDPQASSPERRCPPSPT